MKQLRETTGMKALSPRQTDVYNFISKFISEKSFSPSYAEIAQHLGVSPPAIMSHINAMIAKGYITKIPSRARTIRLTEKLPDQAN